MEEQAYSIQRTKGTRTPPKEVFRMAMMADCDMCEADTRLLHFPDWSDNTWLIRVVHDKGCPGEDAITEVYYLSNSLR